MILYRLKLRIYYVEADGMAIPDKIKAHKPDINQYGATEIRCIKNHFYVYAVTILKLGML